MIALGIMTLSASWVGAAQPTPIPGGANQLKGVVGPLSATLFNGKVRVKKMALRNATAAEYTPSGGNRSIVLSFIVSNGTHKARNGQFSASISDADGVVVTSTRLSVYSAAYFGLQPGAAARELLEFIVPNDFKPTKILLVDDGEPTGPAFRIMLKDADIPHA